ncbi:hypothetical protein [Chroococcidiopsis sp. CCMEE 29]|uniref:hypothetical protein n=1 Tax=Chroococcidiopsis sp. CCMEE 29 TaxID=155894 RepID=UPI0020203B33|nr:hypothetical protein [Chroococcidiopsis sp. CCMEE 29]
MLTENQTTESCSTDLDKEIVHLLNYARTKLLTKMPRQLKMTSYLRLCCLAIRKLHQRRGLAGKPRACFKTFSSEHCSVYGFHKAARTYGMGTEVVLRLPCIFSHSYYTSTL